MKPKPHPHSIPLAQAAAPLPLGWSASRRAWVSLFVTVHVAAVYIGAFSVPPTSPLADAARGLFRPYIEAVDLGHGYRFFNVPGPSHLVRYRLEFADGRSAREGTFPNLQDHWPRLRYHRHFMLTETLNNLTDVPPTPPPGLRPGDPVYEEWRQAREASGKASDVYAESYARHLLAAHDARRVTLWGIERDFPSMEQVRQGVKLGDPRFKHELLLGVWEAPP